MGAVGRYQGLREHLTAIRYKGLLSKEHDGRLWTTDKDPICK